MKNLLNFLTRYNNLIIFLILEGITVYILATGNNYHNTRVLNGIRGLINGIEERINNTRTYLNLRDINENLAAENVARAAATVAGNPITTITFRGNPKMALESIRLGDSNKRLA